MKAVDLNSSRLQLQRLDTSFASDQYVTWMNDEAVNQYLDSGGNYTMTTLQDYLSTVESSDIYFWAITLENGKHIGNIKIDPVNTRNRTGEYGILMGDREEWGKGYASEASQLVIDHCFSEKVNLRKVTLGVVEDNIPAVKLYEKLGFEREGLYKEHAFHLGKWCNVIRMATFNPNLDD